MTPRRSWSGSSEATAVYAPRSLNAPIGWSDSALSSCPRPGSPNATRGVRTVTPRSRAAAARIRSRPTSGASAFIVTMAEGPGSARQGLSPGVAAAGDARRRPGEQLLAFGRDPGTAGLADGVRAGRQACQRVVHRVVSTFGLVAERQVPLLGEDVGGRRGLRAIGHLSGRLDLLAELFPQRRAHLLEAGSGGLGAVEGRGHAPHRTLARRGPQPRRYTPGEYRVRARPYPMRRHHGGRDRPGLRDGSRHGDGDADERARRDDVLLLRQGLQARLRRRPGHVSRPELHTGGHVAASARRWAVARDGPGCLR